MIERFLYSEEQYEDFLDDQLDEILIVLETYFASYDLNFSYTYNTSVNNLYNGDTIMFRSNGAIDITPKDSNKNIASLNFIQMCVQQKDSDEYIESETIFNIGQENIPSSLFSLIKLFDSKEHEILDLLEKEIQLMK